MLRRIETSSSLWSKPNRMPEAVALSIFVFATMMSREEVSSEGNPDGHKGAMQEFFPHAIVVTLEEVQVTLPQMKHGVTLRLVHRRCSS